MYVIVNSVQLHCTCSRRNKDIEEPFKKLIGNLELYISVFQGAAHLLPRASYVNIGMHSLSV